MEVTPLKGSGGDAQHFADRIIAERGVPYGRVAMIPTSAKNKAPPERTFDERDAGGRMSIAGQTLQGVCRPAGPGVRFALKTDLIPDA
jgi:hypothetical protein